MTEKRIDLDPDWLLIDKTVWSNLYHIPCFAETDPEGYLPRPGFTTQVNPWHSGYAYNDCVTCGTEIPDHIVKKCKFIYPKDQ